MNNFFAIYKGEYQKMFRGKKMIILIGIMIILCIIGTVIYEKTLDRSDQLQQQEENQQNEMQEPVQEPTVEMKIEQLKLSLSMLETELSEGKINKIEYQSSKKSLTANLKELEFIRDNNIDPDITTFGNLSAQSGNKNAVDYMLFMINLLFNAIIIFVVVLAAGTITNELKEGTIKLLLLRPIDRNKLLSIKIFTIMTLGLFLMAIILLLSFIYGLLRFGASNLPILFIFNGQKVFLGTQLGQITIIVLSEIIMMFGFVELAAFLATLTKNKSFAMVITLAIMLGITSLLISLLRLIGIDAYKWVFSTNSNWANHFTVNAPNYSFYFTAIMFTAYVYCFSFFNHLIFTKRDIN